MDKYQNTVFRHETQYWIETKGIANIYGAVIDKDTDTLVLEQNENINLVDYCLIVEAHGNNCPIKSISFLLDNKWHDAEIIKAEYFIALGASPAHIERIEKEGCRFYAVNLCFNNRVTLIRFTYKNNMIAPYELKVNYKEASKDEYYRKISAQQRKELLQRMSLQCKTGDSLVNIFWQIAQEDVKKVRVELFLDNRQLIMKSDEGTDVLFKSIQGLAYGRYRYRVSQLNEKDEVVVESDLLFFELKPYDDRHFVTI